MKPEIFSYKAFNPVSLDRWTYSPACCNSQSLPTNTIWPDKNLEMFSAFSFTALYNCPVFNRFKHFLPFGEDIFFHDKVLKKGRREKAQPYKKCCVLIQPAVLALFSSFSSIHFYQPLCSFWIRNRRFFFSLHYWVDTFSSRYTSFYN